MRVAGTRRKSTWPISTKQDWKNFGENPRLGWTSYLTRPFPKGPPLKLQQRPSVIIHRRENHRVAQQLIPRLHHILHAHPQLRRDPVHMQPLIVLRAVRQRLKHFARAERYVGHLAAVTHCVIVVACGILLAVRAGFGLWGGLFEGTAREVEVHVCGFEEVVGDFHFIDDGADDVGADVAFVVEGFEAAPNAGVLVLDEFGFLGIGGIRGGVDVNPLFYFNCAGAVV